MTTQFNSGMVVCTEPLAAEAGAQILRRGGNAMDAAVAAAFAQGVVNPMLCGIGGKGVLTAFNSATGEKVSHRFWGAAGSKARPDIFADDYLGLGGGLDHYPVSDRRNVLGYESIMVPGFVLGVHEAWRRFGGGKLSWYALLEPAILLARNGFEVYPYLCKFWGEDGIISKLKGVRRLSVTPAAADIYLRDGRTYRVGERLVQTDYGKTLERIAADGPEVFYQGEIAEKIAADMEANGGLFTLDDLRNHQTLTSHPVYGTYRDYEIVSDQPPGSGALLIELLNIVEGWDLVAMGWNSPEYLDKLSRAMQLVFADRARYIADPRFVQVPVGKLTDKSYAADLRRKIETGRDLDEPDAISVGASGTTHLSVVDRNGNAVSMTHTLGTASGVVTPRLGFLYNNDMGAFDPVPEAKNSIAPGKTPVNGGAPTILLRDDKVAMVIGSPAGGRKLTAELQAILNVVEFGMSMQEAVSVERIHSEKVKREIYVEPSFDPDLVEQLEALGSRVKLDQYTARLSAIWFNPQAAQLEAGADPRGAGGKQRVPNYEVQAN
jgi:gamma-glutamyltranspeptidase/glutathione hydrolase